MRTTPSARPRAGLAGLLALLHAARRATDRIVVENGRDRRRNVPVLSKTRGAPITIEDIVARESERNVAAAAGPLGRDPKPTTEGFGQLPPTRP